MPHKVELSVEGMSCDGCLRSVRSILSTALDVPKEVVDVDLAEKRAVIDLEHAPPPMDGILNQLKAQGFPSEVITHQ